MGAISIQSRQGQSKMLSEDILSGFREQLRGELLAAKDAGHAEASKVWNGAIDKQPSLIVRCCGVADVMAAVDFVREHQLKFSVRAGGHNVSGVAIADQGLVIDVSHMRSVQVDPQKHIARVEGGARLGDLDHETIPFGLAAPVGIVSETGVAGLTLHGGAGWQMRKHGLSIDNLNAVEIVTADGKMLRASEQEHQDLFWALKGGGGNFGVVTNFEFKLHPIGSQVAVVMPIYPLEHAEKVISTCRDYMAGAPDEIMVIGVYWSAPPIPEVPTEYHGQPVVILLGCYTGPLEQAEKVTEPLRNIVEPIADLSGNMPWKDAQRLLDEDYPDGKLYYWKSTYLDRLDADVMSVLEDYARNRPSLESSIDVWYLGGAQSRIEPSATPFVNRQHPVLIGIEANWEDDTDSEANIAWARALHKDLQPFSGGGNYLNFPGFIEDREAMLRGAYGSNLERLQKTKTKYDPDNLFPGLLNIKPG